MDADRLARVRALKEALKNRVLVLDGAMGTAIQNKNLKAEDFGGEIYEGCNEYLVITRPDIISEIHEDYLKAGADILETNTFGGTPLVLGEFSLSEKAFEINKQAAELARAAAAKYSTPEKPRFVAGSIGPTTKALSVTGGISFDELIDHFELQADALYEGGADYFLIETCQDTRNIKAALLAIDRVHEKYKSKTELPIAVSGTIEPMGTMLAGQSVEALSVSLQHRDLLYIGLNCATGPEFMTDHIRSLSQISNTLVACVPNAGLPDEDGNYLESPEMMSKVLENFGKKGWVNLLGGCCGTTSAHIAAFSNLANHLTARKPQPIQKSFLSGIDFLEVSDDARPLLVGERTNVIGSRVFKQLICDEKWEESTEIARRQIKNAAQIIDICLANPDRDEFSDMKNFLDILVKKISVPMMIDSTDAKVIELALTYSQGKAIINSINLEDGEERFEQVCPLAKKYGAAVIVGCIDDDPQQGMGVTVERKLEIAERSFDLLTKKYGISPYDIYWDPLVFPCGTGDQNYVGSAVHTIDGVAALKKKFPETKTVLGISNVSFGLPSAGREVLNSVFLYHCTKAGLDLAIVNSEKLERFAEIPEHEVKLCEDLLWNRGADPVAAFAAHFGKKEKKAAVPKSSLSLEDRLARYIVEGSKDGLIEDINDALKKYPPLEIINGPLMKGMDEVGKLFNENKLIVAEVLQSAESMKAAVTHLKPFMPKTDGSLRGKVILATVKGDVHDIGKNLVEIILSNNGFEVVNLGIKIPPQELIEATKKHRPQIIGLSGLLVKSAQQMVETASDLAAVGLDTPILVGGAALTRNFVDRRIAPAYSSGTVEYAKDAMDGLDLAKQIVDGEKFKELKDRVQKRRLSLAPIANSQKQNLEIFDRRNPSIAIQEHPPRAPDFIRHTVNMPLEIVWSYINPLMLLGRHLGVKGQFIRALDDQKKKVELAKEPGFKKSIEILDVLEEVKAEAKKWMAAKAVYQFFHSHSKNNELFLKVGEKEVSWKFLRQAGETGLSISDFINPSDGSSLKDSLCLFVTTAQGPVREKSDEYKAKGEYLKSHALMSLALETAEAGAEYLHGLIRAQWGFPDAPEMTMMERFQAKYRGKRYSFGYPACPNLEDQALLFDLLKPSDIGVELTDGFMMSPESSVSALVFSHPQATYFSVGPSAN
ncbi:MAG: methionine synthase [Deltaproteobacteria bacterium]|nr:methionine synthase [Deltaproteobacteria bacterium]